jgi:hypothetical protein
MQLWIQAPFPHDDTPLMPWSTHPTLRTPATGQLPTTITRRGIDSAVGLTPLCCHDEDWQKSDMLACHQLLSPLVELELDLVEGGVEASKGSIGQCKEWHVLRPTCLSGLACDFFKIVKVQPGLCLSSPT